MATHTYSGKENQEQRYENEAVNNSVSSSKRDYGAVDLDDTLKTSMRKGAPHPLDLISDELFYDQPKRDDMQSSRGGSNDIASNQNDHEYANALNSSENPASELDSTLEIEIFDLEDSIDESPEFENLDDQNYESGRRPEELDSIPEKEVTNVDLDQLHEELLDEMFD